MVGGGIVGLAAAYRLLLLRPRLRLAVLEKEPELAFHQTGHNSGVLHAGLYYAAGSKKARLCREGKAAIEKFAEEHGIPYERCGKLVVALTENELPRLAAIRDRAIANGVEGLEEVGPERLREIEPHAAGIRALWSPTSGIIDFRRVAFALGDEIRSRGGEVRTSHQVLGIEARDGGWVLETTGGRSVCRSLVACAGLQSDRVAEMTGSAGDERIIPFRGDYYTLAPAARRLIRGLLYPVPDPRFPFLGVHFGRTMAGEVRAGPNAVVAFAREGYSRSDFSARDFSRVLAFTGFRRLAGKYWRTGLAEVARDWSKVLFTARLRRYVPELRRRDLTFGPSGVRAQSVRPDGTLVEDFSFGLGDNVLHVRNAPSPAATSSLAIGREIAETALRRFTLG